MIARIAFDYRTNFGELVKNPVTLGVLQSAIHDAPQGDDALNAYRWPSETLIDLINDGPRLSSVGVEFTVKSFRGTLPLQSILPDGKNYTVHVAIPNLGLLTMNEVMVEEDCCTDNLQRRLNEGWRILCVCPPKNARRPDYILGRQKDMDHGRS
jgi:hypothetical protein